MDTSENAAASEQHHQPTNQWALAPDRSRQQPLDPANTGTLMSCHVGGRQHPAAPVARLPGSYVYTRPLLILLTSVVSFFYVPQNGATPPMTGYIALAHLLSTLASRHSRPFSLLPPTLLQVIFQAALRRKTLATLVASEHHLFTRLNVHPLHVDCQPRSRLAHFSTLLIFALQGVAFRSAKTPVLHPFLSFLQLAIVTSLPLLAFQLFHTFAHHWFQLFPVLRHSVFVHDVPSNFSRHFFPIQDSLSLLPWCLLPLL